jgi:predicted glutamine amidotransferase
MFMHNGWIGGFESIRWELEGLVSTEFYNVGMGTTGSEMIF